MKAWIESSIAAGSIFEVGGPTIDGYNRRYWVSRWVRLDEARVTRWAAIPGDEEAQMWIGARVSGQHSVATRPDSYEGYSSEPPVDWRVLNHFSVGVLFFSGTSTDTGISIVWDERNDYRTRLTELPAGMVPFPDRDTLATLARCSGYAGEIGRWGSMDYWAWDVSWWDLQ